MKHNKMALVVLVLGCVLCSGIVAGAIALRSDLMHQAQHQVTHSLRRQCEASPSLC